MDRHGNKNIIIVEVQSVGFDICCIGTCHLSWCFINKIHQRKSSCTDDGLEIQDEGISIFNPVGAAFQSRKISFDIILVFIDVYLMVSIDLSKFCSKSQCYPIHIMDCVLWKHCMPKVVKTSNEAIDNSKVIIIPKCMCSSSCKGLIQVLYVFFELLWPGCPVMRNEGLHGIEYSSVCDTVQTIRSYHSMQNNGLSHNKLWVVKND